MGERARGGKRDKGARTPSTQPGDITVLPTSVNDTYDHFRFWGERASRERGDEVELDNLLTFVYIFNSINCVCMYIYTSVFCAWHRLGISYSSGIGGQGSYHKLINKRVTFPISTNDSENKKE